MKKLHIKTFGCQMNEYDTAKMAEVLGASHGLELTDQPEQADVLLLNTCSVREKKQEKVFSMLGMCGHSKKPTRNSSSVSVVASPVRKVRPS